MDNIFSWLSILIQLLISQYFMKIWPFSRKISSFNCLQLYKNTVLFKSDNLKLQNELLAFRFVAQKNHLITVFFFLILKIKTCRNWTEDKKNSFFLISLNSARFLSYKLNFVRKSSSTKRWEEKNVHWVLCLKSWKGSCWKLVK